MTQFDRELTATDLDLDLPRDDVVVPGGAASGIGNGLALASIVVVSVALAVGIALHLAAPLWAAVLGALAFLLASVLTHTAVRRGEQAAPAVDTMRGKRRKRSPKPVATDASADRVVDASAPSAPVAGGAVDAKAAELEAALTDATRSVAKRSTDVAAKAVMNAPATAAPQDAAPRLAASVPAGAGLARPPAADVRAETPKAPTSQPRASVPVEAPPRLAIDPKPAAVATPLSATPRVDTSNSKPVLPPSLSLDSADGASAVHEAGTRGEPQFVRRTVAAPPIGADDAGPIATRGDAFLPAPELPDLDVLLKRLAEDIASGSGAVEPTATVRVSGELGAARAPSGSPSMAPRVPLGSPRPDAGDAGPMLPPITAATPVPPPVLPIVEPSKQPLSIDPVEAFGSDAPPAVRAVAAALVLEPELAPSPTATPAVPMVPPPLVGTPRARLAGAAPPARSLAPALDPMGGPDAPQPVAKPVPRAQRHLLAGMVSALSSERITVVRDPVYGLGDGTPKLIALDLRLDIDASTRLERAVYAGIGQGTGLLALIDTLKISRSKAELPALDQAGQASHLLVTIEGESLASEQFREDFATIASAESRLGSRLVLALRQDEIKAFSDAQWHTLERMAEQGVRFAIDDISTLDTDFAELADRGFVLARIEAGMLLDGMTDGTTLHNPKAVSDRLVKAPLAIIATDLADAGELAAMLALGVPLGQGRVFANAIMTG